MPTIHEFADSLHAAFEARTPCGQLTEMGDISVEDAYQVQRKNIERRLESGFHGRPAQIVGRKIGLTSHAIQAWLNVNEPDFGTLLDDMVVPDGGLAPISLLLQPRAEAEIAFVMSEDLSGPGVTPTDVIRATNYLLPAIEIIDSRIADWKIKYEDTIADNASSGLFVVGGPPRALEGLDLRNCGMVLRKNGRVVSTGAGAACLDHPVNAVAWLANTLGAMGDGIKAGDIVLSGALGPVTPVETGDALVAEVSGLGTVSVRF